MIYIHLFVIQNVIKCIECQLRRYLGTCNLVVAPSRLKYLG